MVNTSKIEESGRLTRKVYGTMLRVSVPLIGFIHTTRMGKLPRFIPVLIENRLTISVTLLSNLAIYAGTANVPLSDDWWES